MKFMTYTQNKRGPKPIGDSPMTPAQRQQRRRQRLRDEGAKGFLLQVEGLHLEYVEKLAESHNISTAAALRLVLMRALDRYVGVTRRIERMIENGVAEDICEAFLHDHMFPELPAMPERQQKANNA
jgi:hypothetical protein